jgi:hypothetical protein
LSVRVTAPVAVPVVVGVNVTPNVHVPPTAKVVPQVLADIANGALATMEVKVSVAVPLFVTVTVCGRLVVFTTCVEKFRVVDESPTMG